MKVLLVDDHALFRAGLRMLLTTICAGATTFEASSIAEALSLLAAHPETALLLVDLSFKNENALSAISNLRATAPGSALVVISAAEDSATIHACLDAGAMGFIPKSLGPDVLTQALQQVLDGKVYLPQTVLQENLSRDPRPGLTARQLQVLQALGRGLPTKQIARELSLSEYTVKEHIALVFQALGARNRTEAVIKGSQWRLLEKQLSL